MSATEIITFNDLNISTSNRNFIIESLNNISVARINFSNKTYSLEEDKFLLDNKEFTNYSYRLESKFFASMQFSAPAVNNLRYNMRARKISDNSFIYWRTVAVDSSGAESGFNSNEIYDICVLGYN